MVLQDPALVAAQKDPVPVHQGHPGAAVLPFILSAAAPVHLIFVQGGYHMLRHLICTKYTDVGRLYPQHSGVDGKVQGLTAGIHGFLVLILVTDIVSNANHAHDRSLLFNFSNLSCRNIILYNEFVNMKLISFLYFDNF